MCCSNLFISFICQVTCDNRSNNGLCFAYILLKKLVSAFIHWLTLKAHPLACFYLVQVILEGKFSTVESSFADLLNRFLDHYPNKTSTSFLWKEDEELVSNYSVLTLKATGCSPYVYR